MSYFKIKRDSNTPPVELGVLVENVEGLDERLALKVDKAEGKGLSTNDIQQLRKITLQATLQRGTLMETNL